MDPNQSLNIQISAVSNIKNDKIEKKGLLKGSEILDKTTKEEVKIDKIKQINSNVLIGDIEQSKSEPDKSLADRVELSSNVKEKDKIKDLTSKNPVLKEGTNASITRSDRMQNKTAIIKEKCIRYMIDPDKQVEDILEYVENSYKNHSLKSTYELAKKLVDIDDLRNISEEIQTEIEKVSKNNEFFLILTRLYKINCYRKEIKKYGENNRYEFNPLFIAKIAALSNELMDNVVVNKTSNYGRVNESTPSSREFLKEINEKPLSQILGKLQEVTLDESLSSAHFYKHFYPIVLCGDLAFYTFEAEIYAYANNLAFLGVGGSERGVHGGVIQMPGDVFYHDILHHGAMLNIDSPNKALYLQQLSKTLAEIIQYKISENLKESFYFVTHLLLHEGMNFEENEDLLVSKNPNLTTLLDLYYCDFLKAAFHTFNLKGEVFEPTECYIRDLQIQEEELKQKFIDIPEAESKKLKIAYQKCEEYKKNHPKLDDLTVVDSNSGGYDIVEALLFVTENPKKKEYVQNKILPHFQTAAKSIMEVCKNKYHITDTTDRNSEVFNAYKKAYNNQLYLYKTKNFDHIEAYKAVKELLINFKEKILPHLQDIDKKNGPINTLNYKNVWEKGMEIN